VSIEMGLPALQGVRLDAETWLGMQLAHDLARSSELAHTIKVERVPAA